MITTRKVLLHLTPLAECGGCEVNCLRIIEAIDDCDHHVVVFGEPGPMSSAWENAGARVEHLGAWNRRSAAFEASLRKWSLTQEAPSAIVYWSTSRLPAVLRVLRRWDAHCAVHLGNPPQAGLVNRIRRRLHEWIHSAPSGVTLVACSRHVADSHGRARYFRQFATEVIYNPVDPELDRDHLHRALPADAAPRVGMVARLDRIKDHRTLIRALAHAAAARPDIVLEFAGDGPLRGELEEEARRLNVADRVRFLGFTRVNPLLRQWDVYLHSTTDAEGMGTAVAEAMMAGLPCLVSDLAVMREVCGADAVYARAADPKAFGDALVRLIGDLKARAFLGSAAQVRARRMFGAEPAATGYSGLVFSAPERGNS